MKLDLKPYEEKMKKSIAVLEDEFGGIRVGKASAKLLDKIRVDYFTVGIPLIMMMQVVVIFYFMNI